MSNGLLPFVSHIVNLPDIKGDFLREILLNLTKKIITLIIKI